MSSATFNQSHRGVDSGMAADTGASASTMSADFGIARHQSEPLSVFQRRVDESQADSSPTEDNQMSTQQPGISLGEIPHGSAEPVVPGHGEQPTMGTHGEQPTTPVQSPDGDNNDDATTTVTTSAAPKAKGKSKFGLHDVRIQPSNVALGPPRQLRGLKKRPATQSPSRKTVPQSPIPEAETTSGIFQEVVVEDPVPNPTASSSAGPSPLPETTAEPASFAPPSMAKSPSPSVSPTRLTPSSPSADLQLQAAVTMESLADRVAVLERLLTERVLAIDDRLQVIEMTGIEHNEMVAAKLSRLEQQGHELSERLTDLEVQLVRDDAPRPEAFDVSTPQWATPTRSPTPMTRPQMNEPVGTHAQAATCPTSSNDRPSANVSSGARGVGTTSSETRVECVFKHIPGGSQAKVSNTQGNMSGPPVHNQWGQPTGFGIHQGVRAQGYDHSGTPNFSPIATSSAFGAGRSLHKDVSYVIDKKGTEGLSVFSGKVVDYERWVERFVEHLSSSCSRWRGVIDSLRNSQRPFLKHDLAQSQMDGFNCWEVAIELGHFTFKYLHSDLYEDKWTLCGGPDLNGFELWRNLEKRYGGTGKAVEVTGLATFMNFPSCNVEANLVSHLAKWEEYLNRYGSELRRSPETLRVMILQVLPKEMAEKLRLKREKYPTFQSILAYVRDRHEERQEVAKAEALHQPRRSGRVSAMTEEQTQATYAAAAARAQAKTKQQQQEIKVPSMEDLANMVAAVGGLRRNNPGTGTPNAYKKFIFRGCWECGQEGHSRHECPQWKRVIGKDGKPPAGHQGAKDKAWKKWKAEKEAARKKERINQLTHDDAGENTEDEDGGEEYDEAGTGRVCALINEPIPTSNSFAALTDHCDDSVDDELVEAMHTFAHHIQVGKKQSQRSRRQKEDVPAILKEAKKINEGAIDKPIIIQCSKDINRPDVQRMMKPLPSSPERINHLASLCPSAEEVPLLPGEKWILFDTGASCNALNVARDCPQYGSHVLPTRNSVSGKGAESANGGSIKERGEVAVDLLTDGLPCKMVFKDMDVSMPIASGRMCVDSGDTFAVIHKGGGTLKNIVSGKEIRLYARQGVYFFKSTILPPGSIATDPSSPFARQG